LASTTPLPAILAKKTDATIVRAALYTAGVARWWLEGEKYRPEPNSSIEEVTFRVNLDLEEQIRKQPSDWFWVHDRWKTPNPRFLLSGYKRGVYVPDRSKLKPFEILIRSSNWLGDAVMSVEAVRRIKRGRPDARVTILVKKSLADFWTSVPEVDAVIVFELGESVFSVSRKLRNRFDVAILFPNSPRSGLEVWLAGIPRRVGYSRPWRDWFLNQFIPDPPKTTEIEHQSRHYLRIAERIGADMDEVLPDVNPRNPEANLLGLCPGAEYGPAKRWPDFARAAKILADKHSLHWLIFGTAKEKELGSTVAAGLGLSATDLTGKTSLAELMQQLQRCQLLLTNDTGTMHLAAHLGVPVVAIFGSTDPVATGPKGDQHTILRHPVECSPCFLRVSTIKFRYMTRITVDQVVQAVETGLSRPTNEVDVRKLGIS
jgi:lipopolysaccharide heptosyltransferase II